jgi:hypothetical protein
VAFFLKGFKMSYSTLYLEIKSEDKIEILNFAATEIREIYNIAESDINADNNKYTKFYFSKDHKELNIDIITGHHIWDWCKQNFDEIASKYKNSTINLTLKHSVCFGSTNYEFKNGKLFSAYNYSPEEEIHFIETMSPEKAYEEACHYFYKNDGTWKPKMLKQLA